MRTKIPGSSGTKGPSRNTSKIPRRRFPAPKWCFRGLRTRRKPKICGASSSSSDRTARRNKQFSSRFNLIIESVVNRIEVDHAIRIVGDESGPGTGHRRVYEFNKVWDAWAAGFGPARTCIEARLQSPAKMVEIMVTAAR